MIDKMNFQPIFILAGIILLVSICLHGYAKSSNLESAAFLWLEYGKKINEPNGSVTQTVYIKSSNDSLDIADIKDLTAFYCDGREKGEKQYYEIPVEEKNGLYVLRVNTASPFRYYIYVTGTCSGEHFTAQISFLLYANGFADNREKKPALLEKPRPFPFIDLRSGEGYWPQTGQTFQFIYTPINQSGDPVKEMKIIDLTNKCSEKLTLDAGGMFSFTPSHDKRLDESGYSEYKEILVYTEELAGNEVYKTSMNLLLHRSLTAHRDLKPGIFLFFATMAASVAIVLLRRRSFTFK
ncbi:hypothetical protein Salpa_5400 [Sporomusa sp. KB1]|nr:hypothetical protein Salpa_5400 [Sporomusa sp. KB1]